MHRHAGGRRSGDPATGQVENAPLGRGGTEEGGPSPVPSPFGPYEPKASRWPHLNATPLMHKALVVTPMPWDSSAGAHTTLCLFSCRFVQNIHLLDE